MTSSKQPVFIAAMGHFHPENDIPNSHFDRLGIGSEAAWVAERTGIIRRRSILTEDDICALNSGKATVKQLRAEGRVMGIDKMCQEAWKSLTSRRQFAAAELNAVICGTSVPDYEVPANACSAAAGIGANCLSFDVNSACSSFVIDLLVAKNLLAGGEAENIAIFNPERYSLRIDYTDRNSCVLFGDGCSAALISSKRLPGSFEVVDCIATSVPEKFDLVKIPDDGVFCQNGKAVQKFAISRTIEITQEVLRRNNLTTDDISYLIGHQANYRMLCSAVEKLGLPDEKHLCNVENFGNQGGAGAPCVLSMNWSKFKPGDLVVVSVVGAGLTWAAALLRRC